MQSLCILGSTGVMGSLTLEVVDHLYPAYSVKVLTAGRQHHRLAEQIRKYRPEYVSVADEATRDALVSLLEGVPSLPQIGVGLQGLRQAGTIPTDVVVSTVVGSVGLLPTWEAVRRGGVVAIANKETLVAGGDFVMAQALESGATILPLDSEHSAIFQCLQGTPAKRVRKYLVTASGGPFRTFPTESLRNVTKAQALKHPNWSMGQKITIDSATLMNKGLEVIEAHHLFQTSYDSIEVVVHPQSIIHSMVEFVDGSILAQMGPPDMRLPIQYALTYPDRLPRDSESLSLTTIQSLTFESPDIERFPALRLAREAGMAGGYAPCILNAANEVAVQAFLNDTIPFVAIPRIVEAAIQRCHHGKPETIEDILDMDMHARRTTEDMLREGRWREWA